MFRQGTGFRQVVALAVVAGMLGGCASASAAPPPRGLWATVNICDTVNNPNKMGVRGSMPGDGNRHERMYMRFHAQSYDQTTKTWSEVKGVNVSGWLLAGSARFKARQAGFTFQFNSPTAGKSFVLRGVVDFQWRERRRTKSGKLRMVVVRTLHANTKGEHAAPGADPKGYSSGTCEIS
ncbi:MAG TPA: hypothetical protein VGI67_11890 [Thermoleophilaceae bacterium]|jgi:hypothetical protein